MAVAHQDAYLTRLAERDALVQLLDENVPNWSAFPPWACDRYRETYERFEVVDAEIARMERE